MKREDVSCMSYWRILTYCLIMLSWRLNYLILPLFQNIRHSRFTKIGFDHKYLSNTINKNYKNYTFGFVLKNTIIILFLNFFYHHKLRVINRQSSTSKLVRVLYCETEGVTMCFWLWFMEPSNFWKQFLYVKNNNK